MGGKKGKKRPITNGIHPGPSTSSSEGSMLLLLHI